jgi:hypothetical protein
MKRNGALEGPHYGVGVVAEGKADPSPAKRRRIRDDMRVGGAASGTEGHSAGEAANAEGSG